jgi:RNA polymerase sigma factor (TIGR02999 family)
MSEELEKLLAATAGADSQQARERLFAALYAQLRLIADRELRRFPGMGVSPTTLVHEAYLNFSGRNGVSFSDRDKFLGYAARAMRGLLIDFARRNQALKRGDGFNITQLNTQIGEQIADGEDLSRLSDALEELAKLDTRLAEIVDLKYFCGFSFAEIATLRQISERTAKRDWEKARVMLFRFLGEAAG